MPDSYDEIEVRIQAAIASIPPDRKPNIAKSARDFAISESRLRACCNGRIIKSNYEGMNQILIINQEMALDNITKHEEVDKTYI